VALDQHYIARETFNKIYQQAEKTSKIISGLITCLRRNEKTSKHKKLNKPDKPDKPNKQNRPNQPDKGRIEKDD
jgi:hypothetical protein